MVQHRGEAARIREFYETRDRAETPTWSPIDPATMYHRFLMDLALADGINTARIDLATSRVLDVGCGNGLALRNLVELGADPSRLAGVELVPGRVARARELSPHIHFEVADATDLPFTDDEFDVVMQQSALCNVIDPEARRAFAGEMLRVLRPGGHVLWYDVFDHQEGDQIRGVSRAEVLELLPGCEIVFERELFHRRTEQLLARGSLDAALALEQRLPRAKRAAMFAVLRAA